MREFSKSDCAYYADKNCNSCYGRGVVVMSAPLPPGNKKLFPMAHKLYLAAPEWDEPCQCVTKRLGPISLVVEPLDK